MARKVFQRQCHSCNTPLKLVENHQTNFIVQIIFSAKLVGLPLLTGIIKYFSSWHKNWDIDKPVGEIKK